MTGPFAARRRLVLILAALAMLACSGPAFAAQIIAVDYQGPAGDSPSTTPVTQSGFTGVSSNSGDASRRLQLDDDAFLRRRWRFRLLHARRCYQQRVVYRGRAHQDFLYSQNNSFTGDPAATIQISGLTAGAHYLVTFYTYDQSSTIEGGNPLSTPFTTSFTGTGTTTGTGTVASYVPGATPTANEAYTSTGTYTSTTGTLSILAQITSNNDFLRINGFTVSTVTPEPSSFVLAGLGAIGLLVVIRRRHCALDRSGRPPVCRPICPMKASAAAATGGLSVQRQRFQKRTITS